MSRSMHSSTEYLGSPRAELTYSSVKFSFTSLMGKISPKTRSRPKSHCSSVETSVSMSFSKERSWTSSKLGIGITDLSLEKLKIGRPSLRISNGTSPFLSDHNYGWGPKRWNKDEQPRADFAAAELAIAPVRQMERTGPQ